ncbi:hypothetical protein ACFVHQ_13410 [Actinomycetes bacterium NPDC127524]
MTKIKSVKATLYKGITIIAQNTAGTATRIDQFKTDATGTNGQLTAFFPAADIAYFTTPAAGVTKQDGVYSDAWWTYNTLLKDKTAQVPTTAELVITTKDGVSHKVVYTYQQ